MRSKKIFLAISIATLVIIGLSIYGFVSGSGKDVVKIVAAPKDTVLTLDGATTIKSGQRKIATGTHTITAKREDFADQTKEFTTYDSQENIIWFEMLPNSQSGQKYKSEHPKEFQVVYEAANSQAAKITDKKVADYPLIAKLPAIITPVFTINYGQSAKHPHDSSRLAIYITADDPSGRQSAIGYIYSLGFDPSDYEIIFQTSSVSTTQEGTGIGDSNEPSEDQLYPNEVYWEDVQ